MTPTRSAAPASQSRNDDTSNTDDSTMMTTNAGRQSAGNPLPLSRVIGTSPFRGRAASPKDAHPMRARLCYSYPKPKGPARRNASDHAVAAPTEKRGFVMSEFDRPAPARVGMVCGHGGGHPQGRPHGVIRVSNRHVRTLRVETRGAVPQSHHGAEAMTQAVTLARTAAPIIPASPAAAPIRPQADTTDPQIIALHVQAENALAAALHLLRSLDCDPAKLQQATGRAIRAATMLKRLSAAQVKEVAA